MKSSIYSYSNGLFWLWLAIVTIIIDIISKQLIINNFQLYESLAIMPHLNFTYARNYGAAFSFLANKGGWQRWLLIILSILICVLLIKMMSNHSHIANKKLSNIAYSLIIGGAIGNLWDRLIYGFVIDFIDVYVNSWHWPTFNVADLMICIGVFLITIDNIIISS